jgi:hypothetical protein
MLNSLVKIGKDKNYFIYKRIGDFDNALQEGYHHINTHAIQFDKTKEKIASDFGQNCLKSCDALDILPRKDRINFIEFKQIKDNNQVREWIQEELSLPQKIKDSHEILLIILRQSFFSGFPNRIKNFQKVEKNFIISLDLLTNHKNQTLIYLKLLKIKSLINKEFKNNFIQGESFNKPKYIKMNEFDLVYPSFI